MMPDCSGATSRLGRELVELTPELRQELKTHLNNLQSICRSDFRSHPRSLKFFLKELHEICELLEAPLIERSYRDGYGSHMLHHFVQLLPNIKDHAELPPAGENLPRKGWLVLTTLLTLAQVPWEFKYNSLLHKVCNCRTLFPGSDGCAAPFLGERMGTGTGWGGAAVTLPKALTSTQRAALEAKVHMLHRSERHFPIRLVELSNSLRARILDFAAQVPSFVEDFLAIPELTLPPSRVSSGRQLWERFTLQVMSEVSVLDRSYALFERLYLSVISKLIGDAVEPILGMTGPSGTLVHAPLDPFREVQTAVICQRLGLMKRQVHFGGPHHLVHFDPDLLVKAHRVVQMGTYAEVCSLAERLLEKFKALCRVLVDIKVEHIRPELRDNPELRTAVVELEAVWAECQFLLQQDSLDFVRQLLDFLRASSISDSLKWMLRLALEGQARGEVSEEEQKQARTTLFDTLPTLVYLDEVRDDIALESQGKSLGTCCRFRELFCPKDDRHHTLRRDFAKFDDQRYSKFRAFLLGDNSVLADENLDSASERGQLKYFGMLHKQLREIAAFPPDDPQVVLRVATALDDDFVDSGCQADVVVREAKRKRLANEARARWVCVQRIAQAVEPQLFPCERPDVAGAKLQQIFHRTRRKSAVSNSFGAQRRRSSLRGGDVLLQQMDAAAMKQAQDSGGPLALRRRRGSLGPDSRRPSALAIKASAVGMFASNITSNVDTPRGSVLQTPNPADGTQSARSSQFSISPASAAGAGVTAS